MIDQLKKVMTYETLLKNAPAHDTPEFLVYLMNNNKVVAMLEDRWLIIENCKYHTPEKPWYTAFDMTLSGYSPLYLYLYLLHDWLPDGWCIMKKPKDKQTVGRRHYHIFPHF